MLFVIIVFIDKGSKTHNSMKYFFGLDHKLFFWIWTLKNEFSSFSWKNVEKNFSRLIYLLIFLKNKRKASIFNACLDSFHIFSIKIIKFNFLMIRKNFILSKLFLMKDSLLNSYLIK